MSSECAYDPHPISHPNRWQHTEFKSEGIIKMIPNLTPLQKIYFLLLCKMLFLYVLYIIIHDECMLC